MADDTPLLEVFTLLCGPCHDNHGQSNLLARVEMMNGSLNPDLWFLNRRLRAPIDKSDDTFETTAIFGENHRWVIHGWNWPVEPDFDGPFIFDGCGRHRIERNRDRLANVIARTYEAGERSLYVTG